MRIRQLFSWAACSFNAHSGHASVLLCTWESGPRHGHVISVLKTGGAILTFTSGSALNNKHIMSLALSRAKMCAGGMTLGIWRPKDMAPTMRDWIGQVCQCLGG